MNDLDTWLQPGREWLCSHNGPIKNNAQRHSGTGEMPERERSEKEEEADGGARKKEEEKGGGETEERCDLRDIQSLSNSQDLGGDLVAGPPTS